MYGCVPQGVFKGQIPAPADGPYGSEASDRIFINKQEEWNSGKTNRSTRIVK